jgi:hypothetical protein
MYSIDREHGGRLSFVMSALTQKASKTLNKALETNER